MLKIDSYDRIESNKLIHTLLNSYCRKITTNKLILYESHTHTFLVTMNHKKWTDAMYHQNKQDKHPIYNKAQEAKDNNRGKCNDASIVANVNLHQIKIIIAFKKVF